jgi:hypothetical protein
MIQEPSFVLFVVRSPEREILCQHFSLLLAPRSLTVLPIGLFMNLLVS